MQQSDQYIEYFKYLSVQHPDIAHDDEVGSKAFQVISVEEAIGDFRTAGNAKGVVVRLIIPTYQINSQDGNEDSMKKPQGGFIIAKYYDKRNSGSESMLAALADAEKITDEFIERMIHDSKNGHPLFNHSLNSNQQINIQHRINSVEPSYIGWMCTFSYSQWWRNCPTAPGVSVWSDGGITPKEF